MEDTLKELVKSIRNRCDIFLIIYELPHAQKLLPTLLEDLYADAQQIIWDYCLEE